MANQTSFDTTQTGNLYTPSKSHSQSQCQHPGSISKVRVIIRVRPFLPHEISSNVNPISCISLLNTESVTSGEEVTVHLKDPETSRNECYKLDAFFGQEDRNVSEIFQREVSPLIPGIFEGYNATVFAYGATGSGKTYTMQGSDELPGLMSLSMSNILSACERTGSTVAISYYEVYLDRCYDLLELKEQEFMVWEDKDGHVHLKGLAQVEVNSMFSFRETFSCAIQRRKVARTGLNDVSSRSHGVLVITISTPRGSAGNVITGKLNLIDLAGNEDNRRTCNDGIRLQESAKINLSLFALSNVIYALNNGMSRIPYRESKLTRILQDSLGGTSHALMVACLNPGEYQESVHTVSLAARSRHVSNSVSSAQKNTTSTTKVDMGAKLRAWLESKGKTKSAQRIAGLHSPFTGRTPSSVNSAMKPSANLRSSEAKFVSSQRISNLKQRIPCVDFENLFNNGGYADHSMQAQDLAAAETMKEKSDAPTKGNALESNTFSVDEPVNDEETKIINSLDSIQLTPVSEKIKRLHSPQRKVLSPINFDVDKTHLVPSDPKTPKQHFISYNEENKFQGECTPLDKFNSRSSNLKSSLAQEYIEFLNAASREELLQLKGIGQKIANYIVEQREISPLKSLNDLEKIGLTSKQVHNMFGRAARGVFE